MPYEVQVLESSNILAHNKFEDYKNIDLSRLFYAFYKKAWFILFVVFTTTLIAVLLSLLLKPHYKITTHLTEPTINQYLDLYTNTGSSIPQSDLFNLFLKKLSSNQNFIMFLQHSNLMNKFSESTSSAPSFNINTLPSKNSLKSNVRIDKDKGLLRENLSTITDDGIDAELTISFPKIVSNIDINKEYIEFTNKEILEDFVLKQRDIVTIEIKKLKHQINLQVETLKKQLTFEINKLEHQTSALKVLKSNLNVKKQLLLLHNKLLNQLYNLRLLTVEHRSTDTALLQKKLELEQLENLTFNVSNILSYHMDKSSEILKIDPNRKLVILLGIFFGFFLSTLIILVQISLTIRKELENSLP